MLESALTENLRRLTTYLESYGITLELLQFVFEELAQDGDACCGHLYILKVPFVADRLDEFDSLVQVAVGEVFDLPANALIRAILLVTVPSIKVEPQQLATDDDGLAICLLV